MAWNLKSMKGSLDAPPKLPQEWNNPPPVLKKAEWMEGNQHQQILVTPLSRIDHVKMLRSALNRGPN